MIAPAPPPGATSAPSRPQTRPRPLAFPGRFEWKILAAVLIVATLPLVATAFLLSRTLSTVSDINARHQQGVRHSLDEALEMYRSTFSQEKESFRQRAEEAGARGLAHAAELAGEPGLVRARILAGAEIVDEWELDPDNRARMREAPPNLAELPGSRPNAPRMLELTFGIDRQVYDDFLSLRHAVEQERDLDRVLPILLPGLFRSVGLELVIVLVMATGIGLFVARRATRRVSALRAAAARVAQGDLSVRVAPTGRDELDDLGRAFDRMVGELNDARARLEYLQKVSAWQEVARRLAHEIKNPLTPIQLAVQQLQSKYPGDDPAYRNLLGTAREILDEEVGSIRRLVDDFSAFAKLPKVEPSPIDLGALIEDFARSHPEWNEHLRIERPTAPVRALCDKMLLRRVLANLVENGVQAAAGANRRPELRLAVVVAQDGTASIFVDDNGPGVPPEARQHVFDPYVTTKDHGTGLGLAIVRKIAIDHGGDVLISEAPAPLGGARFQVVLPLAPG